MAEDLLRQSGPHDADWLVHHLAAASASLVEWLRDGIGIELELITDYKHVGHSVPRLHAPRSRRGRDLVNDLVRAVGEREIPLAPGNPVQDLLLDDDGEVSGVLVRGHRTAESRLGAASVVLASEVVPLDRHRNAGAGLAPEQLQHGFARLSVNLNAGCRLSVFAYARAARSATTPHVKLIVRALGRG